MLSFHPIWQFLTILLSIYVLFLGIPRLQAKHLGRTKRFDWQRHVLAGYVALGGMVLGGFGGLTMAAIYFPGILITGAHAYIGLLTVLLALFGLASGVYMDRKKKQRTGLPLLHGIINFIVVLLGLAQIYTGYYVFQVFIKGNY
jgi:hypothetical protein